ncbi:MAG: GPR endopeptidase [Clostridia bacterium]|nr:GPR endopeptidase [Clostridia bacterium]
MTIKPSSVTLSALPKVLTKALRYMGGRPERVLVAGLGNGEVAADSLGVLTAKALSPTDRRKTLVPGVESRTGLPTAKVVEAVARSFGCDLVVAVDTLACEGPQNLARTIQLSDSGIELGRGVGNRRRALSREEIGVPVLAVGVPMIAHTDLYSADVCVTPTDVERVVGRLAALLSRALSAWR